MIGIARSPRTSGRLVEPDIVSDPNRRRLRILLSEGASTSARETLTALSLSGHQVEVCDPDWHCLCRFSRFVARFHRCPGIGADPRGYLEFMLELLATGDYDVLLPIHEQGLVFAKVQARLPPVGVALPSYESYATALDKARFSELLSELGIAQPNTEIIEGIGNLDAVPSRRFFLKRSVETASRGVWMIGSREDLAQARADIGNTSEALLVQEMLPSRPEHAQAVFDKGRLVAMHAYREIARGAGGGAAVKESVTRPHVRADLERIGARLAWHGALSVDYILHQGVPHFIDCNPRLVEPMSALLAGVDLVDLLVRISVGESPAEAPAGKPGVRSHIGLQAMFGVAIRSRSRIGVAQEIWRLFRQSGVYRGSREELTPVRLDWLSVLPLAVAALILTLFPGVARTLLRRGWGAGLLTAASVRAIGEMS
jgi:predicted ATP-grasp superfamily ATP-dependent carboligase